MKIKVLVLLCFVTPISTITNANQIGVTPKVFTKLTVSSENTVVNQLLISAKSAQTKLQSKQDPTVELKAITDAKKAVETARLKAAAVKTVPFMASSL